MPERQRCLIYIRPHALTRNDHLECQRESLRRYAEQQGYTVVGEATDLASVQEAAQSHSFDILAVRALSQIGRDVRTVLSVMDDLAASGQTIDSVKEGLAAPAFYKAVTAAAALFQETASGAEAPESEEPEENQTITLS